VANGFAPNIISVLKWRTRAGAGSHTPVRKVELDVEDKPEQMKPRPPWSPSWPCRSRQNHLLDVIRKSNVAAGKPGHHPHIGAYTISFPHRNVKTKCNRSLSGHSRPRRLQRHARAGATVTDIVVLVVAANDGVMPQTLEALSHAQAAKVRSSWRSINAIIPTQPDESAPAASGQRSGARRLGWHTIFADVSALTNKASINCSR